MVALRARAPRRTASSRRMASCGRRTGRCWRPRANSRWRGSWHDHRLPRTRLERRRPPRATCRRRPTRCAGHGRRPSSRRRAPTTPTRWARSSTSPSFLNACLRIETELDPEALLDACKAVERELGARSRAGLRPPRAAPDRRRPAAARRRDVRLRAPDAAARAGPRAPLRAHPAARARLRAGTPDGTRWPTRSRALPVDEGVRREGPPLTVPRRCADVLLVVDVGNTQTHFGTCGGRPARRALAVRDRAHVDRRRDRRRAAQPARAARPGLRRPRRVDHLQHRPACSSPSGSRWPSATSATRC